VPGMTVFAPSSAAELEAMLDEALTLPGPSALRWPSGAARAVVPGAVVRGRSGRRTRAGGDVCIVAVGPLVEAAEAAADGLEGHGVSATVWDLRVVKPLDPELIADAARHQVVVTVEDGVREGGAGARIVDALGRATAPGVGPPTVVLGTPDAYVAHGDAAAIRAGLGLDGPGIAAAALAGYRAVSADREPVATAARH
jgi:1-deoxy-D-xylulose-5-phosphate synthase